MKKLPFFLLYLIYVNALGQSSPAKTEQISEDPPYKLINPDGWRGERFSIPIDFAPQIPYKGIEELRFTPGWGNKESSDYWSYAYVWWLEGNPKIDGGSLQTYLTMYYSGLVDRNITKRNIPASKVIKTRTILKKVKQTSQDQELYRGVITMLDYMAQSPITLNCLIHVKSCKAQNHTAILFELSPKPSKDVIWQKLGAINRSFECKGL